MKTIRFIGALAVAGMVATGCTDITNPVEEFGEFAPAWVGFDSEEIGAARGFTIPVIFEAPTRPEEDVIIDFTFGGTAVFGEDYEIVNADGSPRTDVTSAGGTVTIEYDPAATAPQDTMWVFVTTEATDGSQLVVDITDARTADGDEVTVGYLDDLDQFTLTITIIPTGTYEGPITGDLGSGTVEIIITQNPVTIGGTEYQFRMNDFAAGAFGSAIAWAFNVEGDGTVVFAPLSVAQTVSADITGTYDFDTYTLDFDTLLTCCGGAGLEWNQAVTLQ